ncbi:hypothetical protein ID866_818 [Astraeus odoratus]|nr:hypothetical protein ID866_818 [Astraeus odoratus]
MSFGRPPSFNVGFKTTPPDRGSFPLDHYGQIMVDSFHAAGLMERDEWYRLGLGDVEEVANPAARARTETASPEAARFR